MKSITRRFFLKALGALGLSSLFPGISLAASSSEPLLKNMEALTEAIMPSASDLDIHKKLRDLASKRPNTAKIFTLGLKAVEKYSMDMYGKSFYSLDENKKDSVLKWMDELPMERQERIFFIIFRQAVLEYYYISSDTWKTLKYNGPPQPWGFMDYHLPPGAKRG